MLLTALHGIDAILFDMDGTLVDSSAPIHRAWTAWAERNNVSAHDTLSICQGRRAIDTIAQMVPHGDHEAEAQWMLERECSDTDGVIPIAGIRELLDALGPTPWAVVTSASRVLAEARLRAAALPVPQVMITAEWVTRGKPDPQGFLLGAKELGIAPERCLVVEDTPAGLNAGLSANMQLLGISTTFAPAQLPCQRIIADYTGVRVVTQPTLHLTFA